MDKIKEDGVKSLGPMDLRRVRRLIIRDKVKDDNFAKSGIE
jgi:hypothetical protein